MDTPEKRLAEALRIARLKRRLTQQQVADRSNVKRHKISNIETSHRGVNAVDLIRITKAIGVSVADIAKDAGI